MKKKILVALVLIVSAFLLLLLANSILNRDLFRISGSVIGENPEKIDRQDLPYCSFDGSSFAKTPCYSPRGSSYE